MVGISEAIGAGEPRVQEGLHSSTKVLLGLGGFFLLLIWLSNRLLG